MIEQYKNKLQELRQKEADHNKKLINDELERQVKSAEVYLCATVSVHRTGERDYRSVVKHWENLGFKVSVFRYRCKLKFRLSV